MKALRSSGSLVLLTAKKSRPAASISGRRALRSSKDDSTSSVCSSPPGSATWTIEGAGSLSAPSFPPRRRASSSAEAIGALET